MCVKCGINSCGCNGKSCDVLSGTKIIIGHNIVAGDISPNGLSDIAINSVVSGEFNYKSMGNGMIWFSFSLVLNTTVSSGLYQGALNRRIDNLPVTFGAVGQGGGLTMFQGDVFRGTGAAIARLIVAEGLTVPSIDAFDILNFSEDIPAGTWNGMTIRMSGVAPGFIV
jgi:hypothetical protein